jgi:hypothetical protein
MAFFLIYYSDLLRFLLILLFDKNDSIHFTDVCFVFFLFNDESIDELLSSEIHVISSSIVCCFLVEHLHVGILNVVKNRSVSLFVKSCSSFLFTDNFSKHSLFS